MIHKYKLGGFNIVLDVHSGGVSVVDDAAYQLLDELSPPLEAVCPAEVLEKLSEEFSAEELAEAYGELYEMYQNGLLYSEDDYAQFADRMVSSPVKAMCLHIAHDCNLRCKYCFASTGEYGGGRKLMSFETGKRAIDFLIEHSGSRRNLELDFFGGEPLMNFEVVKQIVAYAREQEKLHGKNFRFTITTNGMLLTEDKMDFINAEMSNVVLSLDGRPAVNDYFRPCVNGSGSYDIIVPKFQQLVKKRNGQQYYVRGTFTKKNLDFAEDVLHFYDDLGFDQMSIEPVVTDPSNDYALTEADLPQVFAEYERLAEKIIAYRKKGKFFNFFHFMIDLDQGPCAIKRLRGCGCGNEYVAITPDGDIYPCHQFVGMEEWKMGSLYDGSFDLARKEYFAKANIYGKTECQSCWAKFYCSGGCNANNLQYAGDVLKPHGLSCEMERKRLECAIMIKAALAAE
ncbi:MAG: thioether cross-link-forming SCIFF peptide maturase [Oscillospiraceae bacterium]|nr:thioether cross-link-forming SCIFF peptide maturase [Oscillospiraceae bacterium]